MSALDTLAAVIHTIGPVRAVRVSSVRDLDGIPAWQVMLAEVRLNRHHQVTCVSLGETMTNTHALRTAAMLEAEQLATRYSRVTCSMLGKLDERAAVAILHQLDQKT